MSFIRNPLAAASGVALAGTLALGVLALGMAAGGRAASGAQTAASVPPGWDGTRLLGLVDADMTATAYANGELYPIQGAEDALLLIDPAAPSGAARVKALNTVMGWPGSLAVGPDNRYAYVVSSRGEVARDVEKIEGDFFVNMPIARVLTTVDLGTGDVAATTDICDEPLSVDIAPDGTWLLAACGDAENELTVIPLNDGLPGAPRALDLDVPSYSTRDADAGATYAVIHPEGQAAGVILENRAVALARFEADTDGIPASAAAETPEATERWMSVARWAPGGTFLIVADVAWGPRPIDAGFNGNGEVLSFALNPADRIRGIVSAAEVSKSPEAIEFNRAGDLLAVVNMERTYLPGGWTALFPGRKASSLSLVSVDGASGQLETLGKPVKFKGVLPEDAVFDADGDRIAVAVYQDHGEPRSDGWITFFEVAGSGGARTVRETGDRIPTPRGLHDLHAID